MAPQLLPHFTQNQKDFILSFIPSFETYLHQHNLNGTRDRDTSRWIKRTVDSIMKDERLAEANLGGRDASKVRQNISTYFRNWKNHQYKHSLSRGQPTFHNVTQPPPLRSNDTNHSRIPKKVLASIKDAMQGLVVLDGDITPQQLFYLQEPEHHEKIYKDMREDPLNKDILPCTLGQKAKVKAWANADQDEWTRRKKELMLNVESNRSIYPDMLRASIQQNLDRGVVGTVLVGVMFAFRTESGIRHGISYCGHDASSGREIPHMPSRHEELTRIWSAHADKFMPVLSSSLSSAFVFEKNEDGFPILPSIDFEEADLGEIRRILTEYLEMMWYHTYPQDSTIPSLPWAEIVLNPHLYYDCATFNLSHSFNNPIPCKTAHVVTLYERLLELQDDQNHFRFYTRSEIISNLQRHLDEAAEESEKGREDVEVVAHPVRLIKSSGQVAKYTPPPSPNPPLSPASSDDLDLDNPTSTIRATLPPTPPMPSDVVCNDDRTVDDALGLAQSGEWFSPLATSTPLESLSLETHLSVPSHSPTILAPSHHHNTVVSTLTDQPLNKDIPKTSKQVTKRKRPSGTGETGEKRKSMRTRNAVQFGVQTIANGARSPKARKAHWEYVDEEERAASGDVEEKENPPAKKSRVI